MKAAVLKAKELFSIEDAPSPKPGTGEVIVKVTYCAICGSDLHRFFAGLGIGTILGHEFCGTIFETGEGVTGWAVGDRVVVNPTAACNKCYWCRHGQENLCSNMGGTGVAGRPGAYAEYTKAELSQLFRTPDELEDKEASLAQCLAVALHAVRTSGIKMRDSVVVIGAGPIGLMALQCARLAGASKVYVAEKAPGRMAMAEQLGADAILRTAEMSISEQVVKLTGVGADLVIECSGSPLGIVESLKSARAGGGTVMVVGRCEKAEIDPRVIQAKELIVKGCTTYYRDEFGQALDLISQDKINASTLITDVTSLNDIQQTFMRLQGITSQVKVLVVP